MTQSYQEQHPLLHEDISDVEHFRPPRRGRMVLSRVARSRVRNKVNGVASIFKLWPGFWSTVLTYWWIALGMIAFITLLIYNGINVMALILPERRGVPIMRINESSDKTTALPDVFMHVHFKIHDEINLNVYLPFIEILTDQYKEYVYHLVIVIDDVITPINYHGGDEYKNIDYDVHSLLHDLNSNDQIRKINGLVVEHILLSEYLDMSPLQKNWRYIQIDIIKFLVRAVSIWEKGGIAFDPLILTPSTPHPIYIEKLYNILDNFMKVSDLQSGDNYLTQISIKDNVDNVKPKRLDNIRDIIDAMEHKIFDRNDIEQEEKESLETAESRFLNPMIVNILNDTKKVINKMSSSFLIKKYINQLNHTEIKEFTQYEHEPNNTEDNIMKVNKITETITTPSKSTLPVVMRYLLRDNVKTPNATSANITRKRKSVVNKNITNHSKKENIKTSDVQILNDTYENYNPMIIPANVTGASVLKVAKNKVNIYNDKHMYQDKEQLTVDLHGNILATKTSCHAFIGTLFSNAVHHEHNGNITEFIIHELTLFCKGLISSCNGIDVIII